MDRCLNTREEKKEECAQAICKRERARATTRSKQEGQTLFERTNDDEGVCNDGKRWSVFPFVLLARLSNLNTSADLLV